MVNIAIDNKILIFLAALVIALMLGAIIYIFIKDRKKDQEEIEELIEDLQESKREVEEVGFVEKKSEIEEVLEKMQKNLETQTEDIVESFEKEQEEKSIISYQELLKTLQKETEPKTMIVDELEAKQVPITTLGEETFEEPTMSIKQESLESQTVTLEEKPKDAIKKFKNTDFISPVYGKMEEHLEYPTVPTFEHQQQLDLEFEDPNREQEVLDVIEEFDRKLENHNIDDYLEDFNFDNHIKIDSLEQTLDMPPISPEVKQNEEFLQALKEFRKNLE